MLQKRLELLGSTTLGNWIIDCEVLQSTAVTGKSRPHYIAIIRLQ